MLQIFLGGWFLLWCECRVYSSFLASAYLPLLSVSLCLLRVCCISIYLPLVFSFLEVLKSLFSFLFLFLFGFVSCVLESILIFLCIFHLCLFPCVYEDFIILFSLSLISSFSFFFFFSFEEIASFLLLFFLWFFFLRWWKEYQSCSIVFCLLVFVCLLSYSFFKLPFDSHFNSLSQVFSCLTFSFTQVFISFSFCIYESSLEGN